MRVRCHQHFILFEVVMVVASQTTQNTRDYPLCVLFLNEWKEKKRKKKARKRRRWKRPHSFAFIRQTYWLVSLLLRRRWRSHSVGFSRILIDTNFSRSRGHHSNILLSTDQLRGFVHSALFCISSALQFDSNRRRSTSPSNIDGILVFSSLASSSMAELNDEYRCHSCPNRTFADFAHLLHHLQDPGKTPFL